MDQTVVAVFGVAPFRIGGVELYTRELARQLEPLGTRLVAVFSRPPTTKVAAFLEAPNLTLEQIPELEESSNASLRPLVAILRRYRPRVLHLQFVDFVGPLVWAARLCGVRQVFFTAQSSESRDRSRRAPLWKRIAVRVINAPLERVFCVSDFTRRSLVAKDLLPASRYETLYNSIRPPQLDPASARGAAFRQRFGIPADRELVTQVSWIIPEKGIPQLLDAARLVLRERPATHFAIAGAGSHEAEYKRRAEEAGIAGAVTWTGLLESPLEDGVYEATDVFCLASQWAEAFGWVLAEAMSFGKPAVGTAVGGIPEVIEDGVSGLLVDPPEDSAALARQLLRLLNDASLRRTMGAAARERVVSRFNLESNVARVVASYRLS